MIDELKTKRSKTKDDETMKVKTTLDEMTKTMDD